MSKFLALVFAGVAGAATVSVHEHIGSKDPELMLESMRALAKQAVAGSIPADTFNTVAGFVSSITTHLMESMEECVQVEDRYVTSVRQTLTDLNTNLGNEISSVAGLEEAANNFIEDTIIPGRALERNADGDRESLCDEVCQDLRRYQPCTPPAGGHWQNDVEPCCDTETVQSDVPAPLRSQEWRDLEAYMDCLDTFVVGNGHDASAVDLYESYQEDCVNASEVWESKKEQIDPSDGSVANDLCTMIQADEDKCTFYFTNFNAQSGNHSGKLDVAQEIVENTYQQYEALRKIQCLFAAIQNGQDGSVDVAAACQACEDEAPVCTGMCNDDPECPAQLKCTTCCLPPIPENPCEQRHKCDVCTGAFRHEFYDCPAAGYNNTEALCEEDGDGNIVVKGTDSPPSAQCQLLIDQLGCSGFNCEDICDNFGGTGYIPAFGSRPVRRAYEPFTCGGDSFGNWNFAR